MRTRDEQVESACQQIVQSSGWANLEGWVRGHIQEAEDRAVAAERERCAKVCEELGGTGQSGYLSTPYDPENRGADCAEDMAERIVEAIRSAAK